jgi:hypothetical protein
VSAGTEEDQVVLSQDGQSPGQNLNPGPPEYEEGMLTTWTQLPVMNFKHNFGTAVILVPSAENVTGMF